MVPVKHALDLIYMTGTHTPLPCGPVLGLRRGCAADLMTMCTHVNMHHVNMHHAPCPDHVNMSTCTMSHHAQVKLAEPRVAAALCTSLDVMLAEGGLGGAHGALSALAAMTLLLSGGTQGAATATVGGGSGGQRQVFVLREAKYLQVGGELNSMHLKGVSESNGIESD